MKRKRISAWLVACCIFVAGSCQEQDVLNLEPNYDKGGNPGTVVITPNAATIHPTASVQLSGVVKNPAGNTVPNQTITWSSSNTAVATVDASGKVTGVAAGTAEITAAANPRSGTATITVELGASALVVPNISARHGDHVTLTATLTGAGQPLAGRTVHFTVDGSAAGSGVTNANGVASLTYTVTQNAGTFVVAAHFESDAIFATADGTGQLTVVHRPTSLALSDASVRYSDTVLLEATVTAEGGAPVPGRSVTFRVNGVVKGSATTDDNGEATLQYMAELGAGNYALQASWTGDNQFAGASDDAQVAIAHKNAFVGYTGDTGPQSGPDDDVTLRALVGPVDDGGNDDFVAPGSPLTVRFIVQHEDGFSQTVTATVNASGVAETSIAGLDPRLPRNYSVTAQLLSNAFYNAPDADQSSIDGPASDAWVTVMLGSRETKVRALLGVMRYFDANGQSGNDIGVGAEYPSNGDIGVRVERVGNPFGSLTVEVKPDFNPLRVARLTLPLVPQELEAHAINLPAPTQGRRFLWESSAEFNAITAEFPGLTVAASGVAHEFSMDLLNDAHVMVNVIAGSKLSELRVARGMSALPPTALANPLSADEFTFTLASGIHSAMRVTNIKTLNIDLQSLGFQMQYDGPTKVLNVSASYPSGPGVTATVAASLEKPSASTAILFSVPPAAVLQPIRVQIDQSAPMGLLQLTATNVGNVPSFAIQLNNVPTKLVGCIANDGACRSTSRLPASLSSYSGTGRTPAQSSTAGGLNRPYAAKTSVSFDDAGTSGSSSAVSTMITMNANITWAAGGSPIRFVNTRFHRLAFDVGLHAADPDFSANGFVYPRVYTYVDSHAVPFVMNEVVIPETIVKFRAGTDASPATADRRLAWLPGSECSGIIFGSCLPPLLLDTRTSGSFNCGNAREFTIRFGGTVVNLLDMFGSALPVCS